MLHRLATAIGVLVIAIIAWPVSTSLPLEGGGPGWGCSSTAWARLAAHLPPAGACALNQRSRRHWAALLSVPPHTATEPNGRVYLDLTLSPTQPQTDDRVRRG
jgi:hypothetical protein